MFLRQIDDKEIKIENTDKEYELFKEKVWTDYNKDNIISNPYYYIAIANDLTFGSKGFSQKAMDYFDKAIKCDPNGSAAAHVGKAWLLLKLQRDNYKQQAVNEFELALKVLSEEQASLLAQETLFSQQANSHTNDLSKKLMSKINILGSYMNSIQNNIAVIKRSQRLIDITGRKTSNNEPVSFYGIERNGDGSISHEIQAALQSCGDFTVKFHDLTTREDLGTRDQAIETINNAFFNIFAIIAQIMSGGLANTLSTSKPIVSIDLPKTCDDKAESADTSFDNLGQEAAIAKIRELRKQNVDFVVRFDHLNREQMYKIISGASLAQEDIEITKVKKTKELFMSTDARKAQLELSELAERGIQYMLEINEKKFIPWRSILTLGILAGIQLLAGAALIATGFGATVGMGLITEGVSDLFTAYRAYKSRHFSWTDYAKQKAVSLMISAVSMGWSKMKDAGKGVKTLLAGAGKKEALELAGARVVSNGQTISQTLVVSGNNLKSLACQQVVVGTCEAAGREVLNIAVDTLSNLALEQCKSRISESIQCRVEQKFNELKLKNLLRSMYILYGKNGSSLKSRIEYIVANAISPEQNFWRKQWDDVGSKLCTGILSDEKYLGSPFSMGLRVVSTLNGIYQITTIIDKVHDKIVDALSAELQQQNQVQSTHSSDITKDIDYSNDLNLSMVKKAVADAITNQIIMTTESQLISPWSSYGVGELTKAVSHRIQKKAFGDLNARLIEKEAKKHTIAYSQAECIYYATLKSQNNGTKQIVSQEVKQLCEGIKSGKPMDLAEMMLVAEENGLKIKIVDDLSYQLTEEDRKSNTKIVVFNKGQKDEQNHDQIGHYSLMDAEGKLTAIESTDNNCGYAVIQTLLEQKGIYRSIDQLRDAAADSIGNNSRNFGMIIEAETWVATNYPQEANSILFVGGMSSISRSDLACKDPIIRQELNRLKRGELFSKVIAYETDEQKIKAILSEQLQVNADQINISKIKIKERVGNLHSYIITIKDEVILVWLGTDTYSGANWGVNFEDGAPATKTLPKIFPQVNKQMIQTIKAVSEKHGSVKVGFYGHSLGGALAQMTTAHLMEEMGNDPGLKQKISSVNMSVFNSAGVTKEIEQKADASYKKLLESKKINFTFDYYLQDHDIVQQFGRTNILHNAQETTVFKGEGSTRNPKWAHQEQVFSCDNKQQNPVENIQVPCLKILRNKDPNDREGIKQELVDNKIHQSVQQAGVTILRPAVRGAGTVIRGGRRVIKEGRKFVRFLNKSVFSSGEIIYSSVQAAHNTQKIQSIGETNKAQSSKLAMKALLEPYEYEKAKSVARQVLKM